MTAPVQPGIRAAAHVVCALMSLIGAAHAVAGSSIAAAVHTAVSTPPFDKALWLIEVADDSGGVVYERNARSLAISASVRKLFAATAIVDCLGADTQLTTELWLDGKDVVIKGDGDPSFGASRYGYSDLGAFDPFVSALRARGIRSVRDVVADVSMFDRVTVPFQWKLGNLVTTSGASVDALAYAENMSAGYPVASPGLLTAQRFRDALIFAGIIVEGTTRTEPRLHAWQEKIAAIRSPPVAQLLATMLKNSHNLFAELLYKRISAGAEPGSYLQSREIESDFLTREVGIPVSDFRFVDGSGLASDNLVTPAAVISVLRWMNAPERRGFWWAMLAQPGGDGTLRVRLTQFGDRMRGKTGTVAGVNSLAGIVRGNDGSYRYFAILINHHLGGDSEATTLIDGIATAIADF